MVWGYIKRELRDHCLFNFDSLQDRLYEILTEELSGMTSMIRKFERHCHRFMDGYRIGLMGPMLDYAVKQYTSHRMFPPECNILKRRRRKVANKNTSFHVEMLNC